MKLFDKTHNCLVRPNIWVVLVGVGLSFAAGCTYSGHSTPTIDKKVLESKKGADPSAVAMLAPKTTDDVLKLGIPVYPGSVLADGDESSTVEVKSDYRTYKVKMYAPNDSATVIASYLGAIKGGSVSGAADLQKVTGQTASGDDIEIMLGPAADHAKTLVMVWLTQKR